MRRCAVRSAGELVAMDFSGYALGGLAVGEGQEAMLRTLEATVPLLPAQKPHYLMGVGTPGDLIESVARGIDMFDCVLPTRNGRHGVAFTWSGRINLKNACHAENPAPLDPMSSLSSCARLFPRLSASPDQGWRDAWLDWMVSWINVVFYQDLMAAMRKAIADGRFAEWAQQTKARLSAGA